MYKLSKNRRLAKLVAASVALNAVGGMTVPIYASAAENTITNTNKATSGMSSQQLLSVLTQASGIQDDTEFVKFIAKSFGGASGYQAAISEAEKAGGDLADAMDKVTERVQLIVQKVKDAGNIKIEGENAEAKAAKAKEVYANAIKQKQDCEAAAKNAQAATGGEACTLSEEGQNAARYLMSEVLPQFNTTSANPTTTKVVDTKGTSKVSNKDTRWHRDPKTGLWVENTDTTTDEFCDEGYEMKDGKCVKTVEVAPEPTPEPTSEPTPEPTTEPTPEPTTPEPTPEPTPDPIDLDCPEGYAPNTGGYVPSDWWETHEAKCVKKLADCAEDEVVFKESDGSFSCKKDIKDIACPAGQTPIGTSVTDMPAYMPDNWIECQSDSEPEPNPPQDEPKIDDSEPEPNPPQDEPEIDTPAGGIERCSGEEALYIDEEKGVLGCRKMECPEGTAMGKAKLSDEDMQSSDSMRKKLLKTTVGANGTIPPSEEGELAFMCRKIPEEYLKKCTDEGKVFSADEGKCVTPEKTDVTTCKDSESLVDDKCVKDAPKPDTADKCADGLVYKEDVKGCVTPDVAQVIDEANDDDDSGSSGGSGGGLGGILGALGTIGVLAGVFGNHGGGGEGGVTGTQELDESKLPYAFNYMMHDESGIHFFPTSGVDDIQFALFGPKGVPVNKQPIAEISYQVPVVSMGKGSVGKTNDGKQIGGNQTAVYRTKFRRIPFNEAVTVFPGNAGNADSTLKEIQQYGTVERIPARSLTSGELPHYIMEVRVTYPNGQVRRFDIRYDFDAMGTMILPNPDKNLEKGTNDAIAQPFSLDLQGKITGARWDDNTNTCYVNVEGDIYDRVGQDSASGEVTVASQRYTRSGCQEIGEHGTGTDITISNIGRSTDADGQMILVDDNAAIPTLYGVDLNVDSGYTKDKGYTDPIVEPQTVMMNLGTDEYGNPIQAGTRTDGKDLFDADGNIMGEEELKGAARQINEQYGTNFTRLGVCQGEVSHNVGDVCGYEVDGNGNEVAKRLTDGKGFDQGYRVSGGPIGRGFQKDYAHDRELYGSFTKATGSIGEWLANKVEQVGSFGKATLEEITSIFGGRKFDPKQPTNAPILRTGQTAANDQESLDDIAQTGATTGVNARKQADESAAQEAKEKGTTPKTNPSGVVQQATTALKKVAEIGAGMSNTGLPSLLNKQGTQNMQSRPAASNGTATDTKQDESAAESSESEPSKQASSEKTYTVTGYGAAGQEYGDGLRAALLQAYKKADQMAMADGRRISGRRIIEEGRNADGSFYVILKGISRG